MTANDIGQLAMEQITLADECLTHLVRDDWLVERERPVQRWQDGQVRLLEVVNALRTCRIRLHSFVQRLELADPNEFGPETPLYPYSKMLAAKAI
jgi:hypothetical protein